MKRVFIAPLLAVVIAACSEDTVAPLSPIASPSLSSSANEFNGPTLVTGKFSMSGSQVYGYVGGNDNIICTDATGQGNGPYAWNSQSGNAVPGQNSNCQLQAGAGTVACEFTAGATYSGDAHMPENGERLNFDEEQGEDYDPDAEDNDLFVHYQSNHDATTGKGVLAFAATCGSDTEEGTLDLSSFNGGGTVFGTDWGTTGWLDTDGVQVTVDGDSYDLTELSWTYRSGAGS